MRAHGQTITALQVAGPLEASGPWAHGQALNRFGKGRHAPKSGLPEPVPADVGGTNFDRVRPIATDSVWWECLVAPQSRNWPAEA